MENTMENTMATMIKQSKKLLRKKMAENLKNLSTNDAQKQSTIVQRILFNMNEFKQSKRIGLYLPMIGKEIDTIPILKKCFELNKYCFIPRYSLNSPKMEMLMVKNIDDYEQLPVEPKYQIKQPSLDDNSRLSAFDPMINGLDLILVPGVAFTVDGRRLGHGKGYYDRWLNECRSLRMKNIDEQNINSSSTIIKYPLTIGLAFNEQIVDEIPVNEFDVKLDMILFANQHKS